MLRHLHVKNLALIDDLELAFDHGLNVITGETGAGKSLLMQALGLAVGGRASADQIRHETQEAIVEAVFEVGDPQLAQFLEDGGYPAEGELLLRRTITQNGRGRVYVNGTLATVAILRQAGDGLMHIYGQHEQQTLLEADAALTLLDGFAGVAGRVAEMRECHRGLRQVWARVQAVTQGREVAQARRELLRFQVDEITRAAPRPGEEEALRQEKTVLLNAEKLAQGVAAGEESLSAGEGAVAEQLGRLLVKMRELARIDERLRDVVELVSSGIAQVEEAALALRRYGERLSVNPERLEEIDTRLALLSRLKQKYGGGADAVLALQAAMEQELQQIEGGEESIATLQAELTQAAGQAWAVAADLSRRRRIAAQGLESKMGKELGGLGMKGATFRVQFEDAGGTGDGDTGDGPFRREGRRLREVGADRVEFYLSANPGEPLRPLAQVASGGELSRVMLALKVLSSAVGDAPTLIFDEVDAGIGGAVAEVVGRRLKALAKQRQVLCITHLPQIAAFADHAYTVLKTTARGRAVSSAKRLTQSEHIQELARMLGGVEVTAEARRHAREMLEGARRG